MGRTFIVTGASRGIGAAIVRALLAGDAKARVLGIARSKEAMQELAKEAGGRFEFVAGSLTDKQVRSQLISLAGPRLDGLVLNAG